MNILRTLTVAACAACITPTFFAQTSVAFKQVTSPAAQTPGNVYAADLNNDGITDLLQDTGAGTPGFIISYGKGDGTFRGAQTTPEPSNSTLGTNPLVTADFNNDGKVDIVAVLEPTNQIAYYKGNPGYPFTSPKISTISLPSGWHFGGGAAAADFNRDGKQDLVVWANDFVNGSNPGTTALYVLEGDGTGGFGNPHLVLNGPQPQTDFHVFVGDFDADGKADIATDPYTENHSSGSTDTTTVHVLYGNGDFTFADTTPLIESGPPPTWISVGDLNSDGLSDIVALYGGYSLDQKFLFLYGETSRTFKTYSVNAPNGGTYQIGAAGASADRQFPQVVLGDFNGDGHMDLAALAENKSFTTTYLYFLLGTSTLGQFTNQVISLGAPQASDSNVVAGLFGGYDRKPDLGMNRSQHAASPPYNNPSTVVAAVNQTSSGYYGPCNYPHSGQGFNVCAAGTASGTSSVFHAAVNSFGNLRKIELWVDGKKVAEQHHAWEHQAWFNYTHAFTAGTHKASLVAADVDNRLQKQTFSFTAK